MTGRIIPASDLLDLVLKARSNYRAGRIQRFEHDRAYDFSDKSFELIIRHLEKPDGAEVEQRVVVFVSSIQKMIDELQIVLDKYETEARCGE